MQVENSKFKEINEKRDFNRLCMKNFKNIILLTFYADWNEESIEIKNLIKENFEGYQIECAFGFIDCDKEENEELVTEFGAESLPHVIIVNSQRKVLHTFDEIDPAVIFETLEQQVEIFKQNFEIEKTRVFSLIEKLLEENKIIAFIKGTQEKPRCKFTRQLIEVMNEQNVNFNSVDILTDEHNYRQWIKEYSGWKTLPQVFIKKELVGGLDIIKELIEENEFLDMIPKECLKGDLKAELDAIVAEHRLVLIITSDNEKKTDAFEFSKHAARDLQVKGLILQTFDIESKKVLIPEVMNRVEDGGDLPALFYDGQVFKSGKDLWKFAKDEDIAQSFDKELFRDDINAQIKTILASKPVVVFIKGTPDLPQCGFSRTFVQILADHNVDYRYFDILKDPLMRKKLPEFSNWKTFPQLFINSELIGGLDIVKELIEEGEFEEMIKDYTK